MIRFHDKEFQQYFIDPVTALITDLNGVVQEVNHNQRYDTFQGMHVHVIQMNTNSPQGYVPGMHVHHIDENPKNNALSNLQYLSNEEHCKLHNAADGNPMFGIPCTYKMNDEEVYNWKKAISETIKGQVFWNDGEKNVRSRECPGPGFVRGKLYEVSDETREKLRKAATGRKPSPETIEKKRQSMLGKNRRPCLQETKDKIAASMSKLVWWNNGAEVKRSATQPGPEWKRGRIKHEHFR